MTSAMQKIASEFRFRPIRACRSMTPVRVVPYISFGHLQRPHLPNSVWLMQCPVVLDNITYILSGLGSTLLPYAK